MDDSSFTFEYYATLYKDTSYYAKSARLYSRICIEFLNLDILKNNDYFINYPYKTYEDEIKNFIDKIKVDF